MPQPPGKAGKVTKGKGAKVPKAAKATPKTPKAEKGTKAGKKTPNPNSATKKGGFLATPKSARNAGPGTPKSSTKKGKRRLTESDLVPERPQGAHIMTFFHKDINLLHAKENTKLYATPPTIYFVFFVNSRTLMERAADSPRHPTNVPSATLLGHFVLNVCTLR